MTSPDASGTFVRVCPDCGAEFVPTVEICHDCGATLVTRLADEGADPTGLPTPAAEPAPGPRPPAGWVAIETADLDWALELKSRLAGDAIASSLAQDCASCRPTLSVYVSPADLARAERLAHDLYLEKVPEAGRDGALAPAPADRCPACGAETPATAASCPDCGLAILSAETPPG